MHRGFALSVFSCSENLMTRCEMSTSRNTCHAYRPDPDERGTGCEGAAREQPVVGVRILSVPAKTLDLDGRLRSAEDDPLGTDSLDNVPVCPVLTTRDLKLAN